jgi:hypothetical protein
MIANNQEEEKNVEICNSLGRMDQAAISNRSQRARHAWELLQTQRDNEFFTFLDGISIPATSQMSSMHCSRALLKDSSVHHPMVIAESFDWIKIITLAGKYHMSSSKNIHSQVCSSHVVNRIDEGNLSDKLVVTMQTCAARNRE